MTTWLSTWWILLHGILGQGILLPILGTSASASVNIGIDFRATSGFVTDPAGFTFSLGESYPTTRGGVTFGWESAPDGTRDRSTMVDHRLAGINFVGDGAGTATFRIDLPSSGTYTLHFGGGDESGAQGDQLIVVKDNTTTLATISGNILANGTPIIDAINTQWSNANWPTFNVARSLTFTSTIARFVVGAPAGAGASCLASIQLTK